MKQLFIAIKLDDEKFKLISKIKLFKPPHKTIKVSKHILEKSRLKKNYKNA